MTIIPKLDYDFQDLLLNDIANGNYDVKINNISISFLINYQQELEQRLKNIDPTEPIPDLNVAEVPQPYPGRYPQAIFILEKSYEILSDAEYWVNGNVPPFKVFAHHMHSAALELCEQIATAPCGLKPNMGLTAWLLSEHVGLSSKMLAAVLSKNIFFEYAHPYDLDDFSRCEWLLQAEPALRENLHLMNRFPKWHPFIKNWEKLAAILPPIPGGRISSEAERQYDLVMGEND